MGEPLSNAEKREALERVLQSRTFEKSGRARDLLSYIVGQDIAGEADALKGFSIAVDVFGKDETFDAVSDPLVRVQAGRLREYLKEYYSGEGKKDPFVIKVPRGAYKPAFSKRRRNAPDLGDKDGDNAIAGGEQPAADVAPLPLEAQGMDGRRLAGGEDERPLSTIPTLENADGGNKEDVSGQIMRLWLAFWALVVVLIAAGLLYYAGFLDRPEGDGAQMRAPDLPRVRLVVDGQSPEIRGSAERVSSIFAAFDTLIAQPSITAAEAVAASGNWHILDYALKMTELPAASVDGPKRFNIDIIHLQSGDLLRSESFTTAIWTSTERELVTASKMSGLALPGRVVYADILARGAETPYITCLRLLREYYDRRSEERHKLAFECTGALQTENFVGGMMRSAHGGLLAEGASRKYDHVTDFPDREAALREALKLALAGVDLAPTSARSAREVGFVHSWGNRQSQMIDWFKRANELNPFDTSVAASFGYGLVLSGEYAKAIHVFSAAVEATTRHPTWWDFYYSVSLLMENQLDDAKKAAEPLAVVEKNLFYSILDASIAFEKGDRYRAAYAVRQIKERYPAFVSDPKESFFRRNLPEEMTDRLIDDLRKSGLK